MTEPASLGTTIAELRRRKGMTIARLAETANLSRQHVWRLERGKVLDPGREVIAKLADAFGIGANELVPSNNSRSEALGILYAQASRITVEDWHIVEDLAQRLHGKDYGVPHQPSRVQKRVGAAADDRSRSREQSSSAPTACSPGFRVPDDIKVIAQFLAAREKCPDEWRSFAREAFELRRELKNRGHYPAKAPKWLW